MQSTRAQRTGGFFLEAGTHARVRPREVNDVQERPLIQSRSPRDHGDPAPGVNARHVGARVLLVGGHRRLVAHLQHVDLVVGDPPALIDRRLRGAHVHPPVQL